ncbi:MAG: alpha/beta hydrolase [Hellea sp.]
MRKTLGALALLLLLAMGVVVNSLRPAPNVKARDAVGKRVLISAQLTPGRALTTDIEYYASGGGDRIVLLASLGREASDFNELVAKLNSAGFRTLVVEHQGIGASSPSLPGLNAAAFPIFKTLENDGYLDDGKPFYFIGHAYGNRIARLTSTYFSGDNPSLPKLSGTILLAAGGQVPMPPKAEKSLKNIFNPLRAYRSRMNDVRYAFFADGNEIPDYWKRGWHTKTAMTQAKSVANSADDDSWHCAGGVPMLIVQPMKDKIAPIENAYALKEKCSQDVEIVEVQNAGHALLPEQPQAVATAVLDFLAKHHPTDENKQDSP